MTGSKRSKKSLRVLDREPKATMGNAACKIKGKTAISPSILVSHKHQEISFSSKTAFVFVIHSFLCLFCHSERVPTLSKTKGRFFGPTYVGPQNDVTKMLLAPKGASTSIPALEGAKALFSFVPRFIGELRRMSVDGKSAATAVGQFIL